MGNLTEKGKALLKRSGFIDIEIKGFDEAVKEDGSPVVINLENPMWQKALKDREKFMKNFFKGGAEYPLYQRRIMKWREQNKGTLQNPEFAFLRAEYGRYAIQDGKPTPPSDKKAAAIARRLYGPKWRTEW